MIISALQGFLRITVFVFLCLSIRQFNNLRQCVKVYFGQKDDRRNLLPTCDNNLITYTYIVQKDTSVTANY